MATSVIEQTWQHDADCRGAQREYFFPPASGERRDERERREQRAKSVCAECPVRAPCLDYALARNETHGIWGGRTELERQRLAAAATR